jgi:DNA-binding transcriptional regulator YhcF (GntR family)
MIAMGKWPPGSRLPSVRQSESDWSVNRQTVLNAYRSLASLGLVRHKPNGSYYVAEQNRRRDFSRDRIELENLYEAIVRKIETETDLVPLGVLRMLAKMAESELAEAPEVAFVECSKSQAEDHAREISDRLDFPVMPLALDEIRGKRLLIPPNVRVVFTTSFHAAELKGVGGPTTELIVLPIEISPDLLEEVVKSGKTVVFVESDKELTERTSNDAIWMMSIAKPRVESPEDIGAFLESRLGPGSGAVSQDLFLVSQKEWEGLDARWRQHAAVRPISCRLSGAAWGIIADALRIPFGSAV